MKMFILINIVAYYNFEVYQIDTRKRREEYLEKVQTVYI